MNRLGFLIDDKLKRLSKRNLFYEAYYCKGNVLTHLCVSDIVSFTKITS